METTIKKPAVVADMKKRLADITLSVSWMDFANRYFSKSSSWFYHKMDGIDGNGGIGGSMKKRWNTCEVRFSTLANASAVPQKTFRHGLLLAI